ncbi:MAG: ABC transporter ATP-binding protein [Spirochaetaceae bacterium]|jgi:peptide/nickel transport system ATP-binding protein|nr:ABC transporter ATP-binding protein [Spirochaetaceae bacterium]
MPNSAEQPFLEVKDLEVRYHSGGQIIHAVNGVSFQLKRGKTIGLVGETGAGKTTIAKSILRILPKVSAEITGGSISLEENDLLKLPEDEMRKVRGNRISMVFQDPMTALNPTMRIGKQIMEVIELHNDISGHEAKEKAVEMLNIVGIHGGRYTDYPHQFSGGMKQRVVIAMALACSPELLIADEPTSALDVTIQAQVLDMINDLKKQKNTSMIMITHDLGIVAEVCDDVAVIYAGEIVEMGRKADIFDYPLHPYTKGLFGALPELDKDTDRLFPVPGMPPDPSKRSEGCSFSPRCPHSDEICTKEKSGFAELRPGHFCRCRYAGASKNDGSHGALKNARRSNGDLN